MAERRRVTPAQRAAVGIRGRGARLPAERAEHDADSGVSTIFGAMTLTLLLVVTALAVQLGGAMIARHQAEAAADLGALAGAIHALQGSAAACAVAEDIVTANHAALTNCALDGLDIRVEVRVRAPASGQDASAQARAGPVTTP